MSARASAERGHRCLAHTADVIIEAWGPSRVACLEEAGRAMVETFAESAVRSAARVPVVLEASDDEELLVALLDEIVFLVDVRGVVPVEVRLEEGEGGSVAGWFDTVSVSDVESVGAAPKGVSRSELIFEQEGSRWRCRAMLDV